MDKKCIFDSAKICNDCGECLKCDLNPNKKCNNCGTCLELEGYDTKAIKIDELIEDDTEISEFQNENPNESDTNSNNDNSESEEVSWEYIDDIVELKDLLNDEEKLKSLAQENYPGLIVLHSNKKNHCNKNLAIKNCKKIKR